MHSIGYYFAKGTEMLLHNHEKLVDYYRKQGASIGENCLICSYIGGREAFLISLGDRVVISTDVEFVTHDYSISRVIPDKSNLYGKISIGNNCFVGARSVLMYGIELPDNVIVAAGSVVVNSFDESNIIIGGNPARKIGTWDMIKDKYMSNATYACGIQERIRNNPELLVQRKRL